MSGQGNAAGSLELRPVLDDAQWDAAVASSPGATPFHTTPFLRAVGPALGHQVHLLAGCVGGRTVGLVPLLLRRRGPLVWANNRLPFPYLGPLLPEEWQPGLLDAVRRYVRPRVLVGLDAEGIPPLPPPQGSGWDSWHENTAVIVTGGRNEDELFDMLSSEQRRHFRKGAKAGLTAGAATREEVDRHLHAWTSERFERQGLPPRYPPGAHVAVLDAMSGAGGCFATAVRKDGETVAVSLDFQFGRRIWAWEMGLSATGRRLSAAGVLMWSLMQRAHARELEGLDLLGSPTEGIARFKAAFGAQPQPWSVSRWRSPAAERVKPLVAKVRR